jgi:uncharacterized SAM-binding protein YcdF (DUF218 family)
MNKRHDTSDYWKNLESKRKSRKHKKMLLSIMLSSLVLVAFFHTHFLISYGKWLALDGEQAVFPVDIIVSQGDVHGRLNTASDLIASGQASYLITVATPKKTLDNTVEKLSLNQNKVIFGKCLSETTFNDANNVLEKINSSGISATKIVVVSDRYVLRRIRWVFMHVLGSKYQISAYPAKRPNLDDEFSINNPRWWENKVSYDQVISETQKTIFYWVYYGLLGKKDSWDIPSTNLLEYFTNWRAREPGFYEKRQKDFYESARKKCGE